MANDTENKNNIRISRSTLQNILTAAHDKYLEDAEDCAKVSNQGLADMFIKQAAEAKSLLDKIEEADVIDLDY